MLNWLIGTTFLKFLYQPVLWFVKYFLFFIPVIRSRLNFERKNQTDPGAVSFGDLSLKADLCFEFSSEGEYQQVASLIEDAIISGKKVELVYFSPSVEKTIYQLFAKYPESIRFLRYSIFNLSFSKWITASHLILVRYDFFPEFLIWSLRPGTRLTIIWVSFKKERILKKSLSFYKKIFYEKSSRLIFASEQDALVAKKYGLEGPSSDFRIEQIRRRMTKRDQTLNEKISQYDHLKFIFQKVPIDKRLIFGNVWPEDIFLLKDFPPDYKCLIVPHKLDDLILKKMTNELDRLNLSYQLMTDNGDSLKDSQVVILVKKGVLCELYSDFSRAYVGGGFGDSIHSVLEPLVAGCQAITCGPVNYRSTEFDIAESMHLISVVRSSQEFIDWLVKDIEHSHLHDRLKSYYESYPLLKKDLISC